MSRGRARRWVLLSIVLAVIVGCSDDDAGDSTARTTLGPLATTVPADAPVSTGISASGTPSTATATPTAAATAAPATSTSLPATTASTSTTTSTTLPPTTTTTILTEGAVLLVANATDVPGAAARLSEQLRSRGFAVTDPTNAAGNEEFLDVSKVYFSPAGEPVARSVALLMGLAAAPMPVPAPIFGATAALGEATVLVMVGADLAGKPFPGT